ncbi:hypothetical protein AALA54_11045 [Oscillospiraceae bacterium 44-34]
MQNKEGEHMGDTRRISEGLNLMYFEGQRRGAGMSGINRRGAPSGAPLLTPYKFVKNV